MKLANSIGVLLLAVGLVGCTPPMPPEVKAALADKYVTCVDGPLTVSSQPEFQDILSIWSESYMTNCVNSKLEITDYGNAADLVLAGALESTSFCTTNLKFPVWLDGVVVAATLDGIENIILSPELLNKILTGQISTWQDTEIAALNPEIEFPDAPLQVVQSGTKTEVGTLNKWMGLETGGSWLPIDISADQNLDALAEEGSIGITSLAYAQSNSIGIVEFLIPPSEETLYAESAGVDSAGTQMTLANTGNEFVAEIDPTIEPTASEGTDEAAIPWHGVSQTTLNICQGSNELAAKAFAKFILRLDSQGELVGAGHNGIPEQIRIELLTVVSAGLPEPSIPPSGEPEELVPDDLPSDEPVEEVTDVATPEPTS